MSTECHRFFAFSKRVPKDVKRFCGICRQHGQMIETRGHICDYRDCDCNKCALVRSRRLVMSQQIRLRRAQDKRFQRTTEPEEADVIPLVTVPSENSEKMNDPVLSANSSSRQSPQTPKSPTEMSKEAQLMEVKNMCYFCQKCKNHGILVWKKHHKSLCPYTSCTCEHCELIETRRKLDQHIKKRKTGAGHSLGEIVGEEADNHLPQPPPSKKVALPDQFSNMPTIAKTQKKPQSMPTSPTKNNTMSIPNVPMFIRQQQQVPLFDQLNVSCNNTNNWPLDQMQMSTAVHQHRSPSTSPNLLNQLIFPSLANSNPNLVQQPNGLLSPNALLNTLQGNFNGLIGAKAVLTELLASHQPATPQLAMPDQIAKFFGGCFPLPNDSSSVDSAGLAIDLKGVSGTGSMQDNLVSIIAQLLQQQQQKHQEEQQLLETLATSLIGTLQTTAPHTLFTSTDTITANGSEKGLMEQILLLKAATSQTQPQLPGLGGSGLLNFQHDLERSIALCSQTQPHVLTTLANSLGF